MQIFLLLISLNVDFYNFRSSHRAEGFLFHGNNPNICTIIDFPNLVSRSLKKAVVDLIFSVVAGLQSSALLGNELPYS